MNTPTLPTIIVTPAPNILTTTDQDDLRYSYSADPAFDNSEGTSAAAISAITSTRPATEPPAPRVLVLNSIDVPARDFSQRPVLNAPQVNMPVQQKRGLVIPPNIKPAAVSKTTVKARSSMPAQTKSTKPNVFYIAPGYLHSVNTCKTDSRKLIQRKFLLHSIQGIKDLCILNGITLSDQTRQSLVDSEGQYVTYINPAVVTTVTTKYLNSGVSDVDVFNNQHISDFAFKMSKAGSKRFCPLVRPSTGNKYEAYMRQLYNFLAIIGDYQSMLILLEYPPSNPPPMNPRSILLFVYHRMEFPGTPLYNDHEQSKSDPLKDVFGQQVLSEGSCRSKSGLSHIFPVIKTLHQSFKQGGTYMHPCEECRALFQVRIKEGITSKFIYCKHHQVQPPHAGIIFGFGNPVSSQTGGVARVVMTGLQKKSGHIETTRDSILPPEVKGLWKVFLATGFKDDDFMRYTMLLQAITLGNRTIGLLGTTMASFNDHLEYGTNSIEFGIQSVGVSVQEKQEQEKTVYSIKFKDDHPWFCFLRHFLIYIWCFRSEAGLHPDAVPCSYTTDEKGDIVVPEPDLATEIVYPLPMSAFLQKDIKLNPVVIRKDDTETEKRVKELIVGKYCDRDFACKAQGQHLWCFKALYSNGIINATDNVNLGNHSTRKSCYFWAITMGGDLALVKEHVRHRTDQCEALYRGDSCTMQRLISEDPELARQMDTFPFEASIISHKQANYLRLQKFKTTQPLPHVSSIQCLAAYFVKEMLHVSPDHKQAKDPLFLLKIAYSRKFGPSSVTNMEQLIKTTPMSYERRQQFYRAYEASKEGATTKSTTPSPPVSYAPNPSQVSATQHTAPPGALGVFGPSYELTLACQNDRPVEEFKLLQYDAANKSIMTRFRMDKAVTSNLKQLIGRPSVFACHRLIHEVASTTAYHYDKSTAVHTPIDDPNNAAGAFNVLPRLNFGVIRSHRTFHDTLRYFAKCLFTCHGGQPHCFLIVHPNWAIVPNNENQISLCLCTSDECVKNKDIIYSDKPKPPKVKVRKAAKTKKRKVDKVDA
jgi:hypothetical protein